MTGKGLRSGWAHSTARATRGRARARTRARRCSTRRGLVAGHYVTCDGRMWFNVSGASAKPTRSSLCPGSPDKGLEPLRHPHHYVTCGATITAQPQPIPSTTTITVPYIPSFLWNHRTTLRSFRLKYGFKYVSLQTNPVCKSLV